MLTLLGVLVVLGIIVGLVLLGVVAYFAWCLFRDDDDD